MRDSTLKSGYVKTPLILALLGLMFSVLYGLGGILSIISLSMSVARLKKKSSETLKWSAAISAVTVFVCAVYVVFLVLAVLYQARIIRTRL